MALSALMSAVLLAASDARRLGVVARHHIQTDPSFPARPGALAGRCRTRWRNLLITSSLSVSDHSRTVRSSSVTRRTASNSLWGLTGRPVKVIVNVQVKLVNRGFQEDYRP